MCIERLEAIERHCNAHPGREETIWERLERVEAHCHVHPGTEESVADRLAALEAHCNLDPPKKKENVMIQRKKLPPRDSKGRFRKRKTR